MMRDSRSRAWIAVALTALAACSHAATSRPQPAAKKHPVATASPALRPAQTPTASPAPTPSPPTPAPVQTPKRTGAPLPPAPKKVPRIAADAAPQILDVAVSETTVHAGDRVFGRVVTTSNVASVEARIGGYAMSLVKTGVGRFELTYTVAPLPWFIHGNFTMQVIARNTRGDAVTRAIPLTVR
jgi:hypothetical protein